MDNLILIKYGELTTKIANRSTFVKLLANNIKKVLGNTQYNIKFDRVRMYIECNDCKLIVEKLLHVFGIHGIVVCHKVNNNIEDIKSKV